MFNERGLSHHFFIFSFFFFLPLVILLYCYITFDCFQYKTVNFIGFFLISIQYSCLCKEIVAQTLYIESL